MLTASIALVIGLRGGWAFVIAASAALWTLTQFGVMQDVYAAYLAAAGFKVPIHETGAFELAAWQFLWLLGMYLGWRQQTHPGSPSFPPWLVALAVSYAVVCMAWRHAVGQAPFGADVALNMLFDKWRLGPLRLVNFFALLVVVMHFGPRLAARVRFRALETLGQASLAVFCAHIVAVLLVLSAIGDKVGPTPLWAETLLLAAILGGLYVTALAANRLAREERAPASRQPAAGRTAR
jgi:hypothetical protein